MRSAIIAIQFMTRIPMPRVRMESGDFAASMRWFPLVGMIVGAMVWGAAAAGAMVDPMLGGLLALVMWVAVTGALHLDGLGDIADAAGGAHRDPARLDAVLADPHAGTFAVTVIALQLLAKFALLVLLLERGAGWPLLAVAALARLGTLMWNRFLPQRGAGLGSQFAAVRHGPAMVVWSVGGIIAAWFAPPLLLAPVVWALWAVWLKRRIGGISGDGHGAGIELCETAMLLALVVAG
ncbi:adenosylcobinamide-GDP ribazoletransferase [uncultured Croceicoccus sp.]|uniref:adenosylcobinamide-GDP ribazoletransferase n=1 Tax=uncultured Croceicoccus sp. TaxID=1295329 RepID=UPI002626AFC8|nr:adenosylcobinamide-GDP ribazoletransferase [uncultured Croceicoccus sp.]